MNETQANLDRLERRIENQAARIDALYELLELRDDESEDLDPSCGWERRPRPKARRVARFHVGEATGV